MRTYIGTGLLGAAFVKAFLNRDEKVRVWNRTLSKAKPLEKEGAEVVETLEEAVKDADIIHMTLRDDATVEEVLSQAQPHLKKGAYILDHTTTSVEGAKKRTEKWKKEGIYYLHTPVMMGPDAALHAKGSMLASGNQEEIKKILPEIEPMTGQVINLGDETGAAAAMKLITNLYLVAVNSGLGDILNIAKVHHISPDSIKDTLGAMNPEGLMRGSLNKLVSGTLTTDPSWELTMARKDVRLMIEEGKKSGNRMVAMPAAAAEMDKWIDDGHAHEHWSVFASAGAE